MISLRFHSKAGIRPRTSRLLKMSSINYEEAATRRRIMVISLHDRISGHAGRVRVLDRFLGYAKSKPGVWFARKDQIADWAIKTRGTTPFLDRGPVGETGLSGPAA